MREREGATRHHPSGLKSMVRRVLFVTNEPSAGHLHTGFPARYRCLHPAERLAGLGVTARVTCLDAIAPDDPPDSDLYVFHRPPHTKAMRDLVARLDRLGRAVVADQDDLSFDVSAVMRGPAIHMTSLARESTLRAASEQAAALRLFRRISVSNAQIARRVRALHPAAAVSILRDAPSVTAMATARSLLRFPPDPRKPNRIAVLGNCDLATIAQPLAAQLHQGLELLAVGPVAIPPVLQSAGGILSVPGADPYQTLALLRSCGTVIAPQAFPEHGAAQAWRTFLEATLAGCRFIGTATPALKPCLDFGAKLLESPGQWAETLAGLAEEARQVDGATVRDVGREDELLTRLASRLSTDRDLRQLISPGFTQMSGRESEPVSDGAATCAC